MEENKKEKQIKKPQKKTPLKKKVFENLDKYEYQEIILSNSNRPEDSFLKHRYFD